ncbi:MAG: VWA-like domain-containing protein, partial [Lachnospiraceae bacterium]|nr:VWA-like domain-containing protein [Lachnospiraceae bacterium]
SELIRESRKAGREPGMLDRILSFEMKERNTLRDVLSKFAVIREEVRVDPDSFDYGFYNYGMELFGNMPLIEENEYAESKRISELVIAIDTSASVSDETVRQFLNETASVLLQRDQFFRNFELHLMECDAAVHGDVIIRDAEEMRKYADGLALKGGGGTDFRPVFAEVERLRKQGALRNLKGLMYFSDGLGQYPASPPPYDTVFVLPRDDYEWERDIPDWVLKVYVTTGIP